LDHKNQNSRRPPAILPQFAAHQYGRPIRLRLFDYSHRE
jgi:hypothetical protein